MSIASTNTVKPRKAVLEMPEYHPPLAGRDGLRLDFNENTLAPSPKVTEILQQISTSGLTKYPEREPVEKIAAAHFNLAASQVLLTNGVDEAIHLVCEAFLEPEDEALIAVPTFSMYEIYVAATGAQTQTVQADESLQFPLEKFLSAIHQRTKLICIASPNNPTGAIVSREDLLKIAAAAPQAILLVDEAYYHFHGASLIQDTKTVTNLIVARTFSKAYGLANLRIGLLAGHPDVMQYVRKVSSPYNVNGIALECLPAALADEEYIRWYSEQVRTGRERVEAELAALGIPYWPSHANFVLMKIGPKHKELVDAMRKRDVLVRDRSKDPGCEGCVRITIGVQEHVEQGLQALKASLEEIGWQAN
ncbi:MAG: histidinol-phosphate transaminase [Acidobacteriaceae bacterium]